jgi:hypothetical protein
MMRKLRTFLVALLLVPALVSTANAFTTEGEGTLSQARPRPAMCWMYFNGMWWAYQC